MAKAFKAKPTSANVLTKHTLRVLDLRGFKVFRCNNGGVYDPVKKCFRLNPGLLKGVSDIIGFNRTTGKFIAVEIKAGKDKLSPEQNIFLNEVFSAGGHTFIIRTIQDIEDLNKKLGNYILINPERW